MAARRVLVLMHPDLVPPESLEGASPRDKSDWKSLYDVVNTLRDLGHEVEVLGVQDSPEPIAEAVSDWRPHIVFNLLEEFYGRDEFDQHVVSYLEMLRVPYTGCNPRGMVLSRSKSISKKLLAHDGVATPEFFTVRRGRRPRRPASLEFPLIVKSLTEDASLGISQASLVDSDEKLAERVEFIHESIETHALVEQYIDGREIYIGMVGNKRHQLFPPWELTFEKLPAGHARIATERIKHDHTYQDRHGIFLDMCEDLGPDTEAQLQRSSRKTLAALDLDGYARLDYRLSKDGVLYFLEANANPDVGEDEDFAAAAETGGLFYPDLLEKIISLGLSRAKAQAPR